MHKKLLYTFLSCLLFLIFSASLNAKAKEADKVDAWDRSQVEYRHPEAGIMEMYKEMSIYRYDRYENPETIWDKIRKWLLSKFINSGIGPKFIIYTLIGLAIFILVFVILKLLGVRLSGLLLFSNDTKVTNLNFKAGDDDIYNKNLDSILKTAIERKAYREAVRILYLLSIRALDATSLIDWKPWKTDKEYYYELQQPDHKTQFKNLVINYEYIWYGQFSLDERKFDQIHAEFNAFNHSINPK
ncbi:DUF4129 domain-containing protein [Labilibacter sediminis]|nr:DUF4129 domain-containing protein [Labilibacter sediminis]